MPVDLMPVAAGVVLMFVVLCRRPRVGCARKGNWPDNPTKRVLLIRVFRSSCSGSRKTAGTISSAVTPAAGAAIYVHPTAAELRPRWVVCRSAAVARDLIRPRPAVYLHVP